MIVHREKTSKREAIVEAARLIFSTMGFYQARVEDIAREAGIGKGTVYEYFASKEELYLEMLLEVAGSYITGVEMEIQRQGTPQEKLAGIARYHLQFVEENGPLAQMTMQDPGPINQALPKKIIQISERVIDKVAALIMEAVEAGQFRPVDPVVAAMFFLGGVSSVIRPGFMDKERAASDILDVVLDFFLQGMIKAEG